MSIQLNVYYSFSNLSYLEPSNIEEELKEGENRDTEIQIMSFVALGWVKELSPDETRHKEAVYSNGHHLLTQNKKQIKSWPSQDDLACSSRAFSVLRTS